MSKKELKDFTQMFMALKRITQYQTSEKLYKDSSKDYGLDYTDALEMSYENIQEEAKSGIRNVRLPKIKPLTQQ